MILPVCYKPEQDELLYGWILGLARANGLDGHNPSYSFINFFMKEKLPTAITEGNAVKLDYLSNMEMVCERYKDIPCFPELETIIRNMTPLYTLFPLLPVGLQVKRSQYLLRERSGGMLEISHRMEDINELKVCPDCMREDRERIGEAYYHTWHQLPEVRVCVKHHKPLMRIMVRKKPYLDIESVRKSMEEVELCAPLEVETKIAEFMKVYYAGTNQTNAIGIIYRKNRGDSGVYFGERETVC